MHVLYICPTTTVNIIGVTWKLIFVSYVFFHTEFKNVAGTALSLSTTVFGWQFKKKTALAIFFNIHFSARRNSILIRSNKMQKYAGIYLLQNHSVCFGCASHPSSGVHKNVTAASGTGHSNNRATNFLQRGLWPRWRKFIAMLLLWPVPEAAVTVLCTPDDGCDAHPKHTEWFCSK